MLFNGNKPSYYIKFAQRRECIAMATFRKPNIVPQGVNHDASEIHFEIYH